jgi:hypothetical protein
MASSGSLAAWRWHLVSESLALDHKVGIQTKSELLLETLVGVSIHTLNQTIPEGRRTGLD